MTTQDEQPPDGVPEADFLEQHTFADGEEDGAALVPDLDLDGEADPADLQEQLTPVPLDDDDRR
jgi:hypothetical protein